MAEDPIGLNKGPRKILAETFHCRILNGLHHIVFVSGGESFTFVLPVPQSKGLGRALTKQVEEIEKKIGKEFNVRLSDEPMPSPLASDFKGGDSKKDDSDDSKPSK